MTTALSRALKAFQQRQARHLPTGAALAAAAGAAAVEGIAALPPRPPPPLLLSLLLPLLLRTLALGYTPCCWLVVGQGPAAMVGMQRAPTVTASPVTCVQARRTPSARRPPPLPPLGQQQQQHRCVEGWD